MVVEPTVYNVTLTDANTEYSQVLATGASAFSMQCRTSFAVRFAWVTGKVATPTAPYGTMKADSSYDETFEAGNQSALTIYLASGTAGVVVEITVWA